jgi:ferredoxin
MIVVDEDTCAVDLARYFLGFTQAESCGKCVPCRVGTYQMGRILDDLACGRGKPEDISKLQNLAETVRRTSLCGLGQTAPNPVLTTLRHFRAEYLAHAKEKICPAAGCKELVEYHIDPGKCTGCQRCVKVCPTEAIRGARSETHVIDPNLCIRCKACFEVCRYDTLAGNAITYSSRRSQS